MSIEELNNFTTNDNFDIEVFEVIQKTNDSTSEVQESLRPLFIAGANEYDDKDEYAISEEMQDYDKNYAQHYVDLFADGEMDEDAQAILNGSSGGVFKSTTTADKLGGISPYSGDGAFDPDDLKEPC